jgi:hypothetical protein
MADKRDENNNVFNRTQQKHDGSILVSQKQINAIISVANQKREKSSQQIKLQDSAMQIPDRES